jgi:ABC-2 type transport system permease protein
MVVEAATQRPVGAAAGPPLTDPGRGSGPLDVLRRRRLLGLLVRKELKVRYRTTFLGFIWSYVRPAVQFAVYYFVIGAVLGASHRIPNYAIHVFSGFVVIHFFTETMRSSTRSIVSNKGLVGKIFLPREMFPAASILVSIWHLWPQVAILILGAALTGWVPTLPIVGAFFLGTAITLVFASAIGLVFSALNVFFRDFQNIVDVVGIVVRWSVPMVYSIVLVRKALGGGGAAFQAYLLNPLVPAVQLIQRAFWVPTVKGSSSELLPHLYERAGITLGVCLVLLGIAQLIFSRLQDKFAQEL